MALAGLHVTCQYVAGAARSPRDGSSLLMAPNWSETITAVSGVTANKAPSADNVFGPPCFSISSAVDGWVAIGEAPDAAKEPRIYLPAGGSKDIVVPPGSRLAWEVGAAGVGRNRVVATRGEITSNFAGSARTNANQAMRWRSREYAGAGGIKAGTGRIVVNSFLVPTNGPETDGPAYDVRGHIEVGGVAYPVKWGGQDVGRCPVGAAEYVSDVAIGMPDVPAGTEMYIVVYRIFDVGAQPTYLSSTAMNPAIPGDSLQTAATGVDPAIGTAGPHVPGNGWAAAPAILPQSFVIIGEPLDRSRPAMMAVAASIERGLNEGLGDGLNGAGGYVRRGLTPANGTKFALINGAHAGESSDTFLENGARRRAYLKYADVLLIGYGGNDYSRGRTSAETIADCATIAALAMASGVRRIGFLRMAPKSLSADGWTTVSGQTIRPNFLAFRSYIDAQVLARGWTLIDVASAYEASPGIWKPNITQDGTHPEAAGHALSAAALQSVMGPLLSLLVA